MTTKAKTPPPDDEFKDELEDWPVKQRKFVELYLKYNNATKAAKEAGYSEKTAYSAGWRLLKKAEIKKEIKRRLESATISVEASVKIISDVAQASLQDYLRVIPVRVSRPEKVPLYQVIAEEKAALNLEEEYYKEINSLPGIDDEQAVKLMEAQRKKIMSLRLAIARMSVELELNPNAYRVRIGPDQIENGIDWDVEKIMKDERRGIIKKFKQTDKGTEIEMYPADAAAVRMLEIYGKLLPAAQVAINNQIHNENVAVNGHRVVFENYEADESEESE